MSAFRSTPGPWHRNIKPASRYPTIFAGRNTHVAYVAVNRGAMPDEEIEANLVLIQHAPAMLDLLQTVAAGNLPAEVTRTIARDMIERIKGA